MVFPRSGPVAFQALMLYASRCIDAQWARHRTAPQRSARRLGLCLQKELPYRLVRELVRVGLRAAFAGDGDAPAAPVTYLSRRVIPCKAKVVDETGTSVATSRTNYYGVATCTC